jgi:hypothetical protein
MTPVRTRQVVRRLPHLWTAGVIGAALAAGWAAPARAGKNDLRLLNLCPRQSVTIDGAPQQECSWFQRDASGLITGPARPDADGQSAYRSLMSELGVVVAPRLMTPADTLGYAGFQFSAELGVTKINNNNRYWDGVQAVDPANRMASRPDAYITTVGGYVRKGLWLPLPAFEFGAGALKIVDSNMYAIQGYAKFALQEGFHGWALPSFAVRGSVSQLLGTDQVDLTVWGIDVLASKAFSIGGTARIEPFLGWNILFIDARSGVIDGTPGCDAFAVNSLPAGSAAPSPQCASAQSGSWNDLQANFVFPAQDIITRQRWFGGFKLKLSVVFLAAELDIVPRGSSHDATQPEGAADLSGTQETYSLSGGFDF